MSVYRAAKLYNIPESTLRDWTRCKVEMDARSDPERIFNIEEETQLVEHVKYMADIGYGYTKSKIQYMAADFAGVHWKAGQGRKRFKRSLVLWIPQMLTRSKDGWTTEGTNK